MMTFVCPIHGYYTPTPGVTAAICPTCGGGSVPSYEQVVRDRDQAIAERDDARIRLDERATIIEELEASRDRAHEDRRAAERKLAISEQRRWKLARVREVTERIVDSHRAGHIIGSDLIREARAALADEKKS